jgi:hypothetical protein
MYPSFGGYSARNFNVFYSHTLMPNADYVGFKDLGEGWGEMIIHLFNYKSIVVFSKRYE